jgi:hypothetical protein
VTDEQIRALMASDDACLHGIAELKTQVALVVQLINGNADQDIAGIRPRLGRIEQRVDQIPPDIAAQVAELRRQSAAEAAELRKEIAAEREKRTNLEQRWIAVKWLLGGLGITSGGLAATVARLIFGGP